MSTATKTLNELYEKAAEEFARRVMERFSDSVNAIVLYGSVARGKAGEDSDIDVLVLTKNGGPTRTELVDIGEDIDYDNEYRTLIMPLTMTPERLRELRLGQFPIADAILTEGLALNDDGTFERIRESAAGDGRRNAQ